MNETEAIKSFLLGGENFPKPHAAVENYSSYITELFPTESTELLSLYSYEIGRTIYLIVNFLKNEERDYIFDNDHVNDHVKVSLIGDLTVDGNIDIKTATIRLLSINLIECDPIFGWHIHSIQSAITSIYSCIVSERKQTEALDIIKQINKIVKVDLTDRTQRLMLSWIPVNDICSDFKGIIELLGEIDIVLVILDLLIREGLFNELLNYYYLILDKSLDYKDDILLIQKLLARMLPIEFLPFLLCDEPHVCKIICDRMHSDDGSTAR